MHIEEILSEELKKQFKVTFQKDEIQSYYKDSLSGIAKRVKIQGFRPGHAPFERVEKEYGESVFSDTLEKLTNKAFREVRSKVSGELLQNPYIDKKEHQDSLEAAISGQDLSFVITCELMPAITIMGFDSLTLEKIVVDDIPDNLITKRMNKIAQSHRHFTSTPDHAAGSGDKVVYSAKISMPGKGVKKFKDLEIIVGSPQRDPILGKIVSEVEGLKKDSTKIFTIEGPNKKSKKSKEALECQVNITDVLVSSTLPVGEELAKSLGYESYEDLKKELKENITKNFEGLSRLHLKRYLLDKLHEQCAFSIPEKMSEGEFKLIWSQLQKELKDAQEKGEEIAPDLQKPEQELKDEYRKIAERRVALGLLVAKIAKDYKIRVTEKEFNAALIHKVSNYPYEIAVKVADYYKSTESGRSEITFPILEDKVVDHILSLAKLNENKVSYSQFKQEIEKIMPVEYAFPDDEEANPSVAEEAPKEKPAKKTKKA